MFLEESDLQAGTEIEVLKTKLHEIKAFTDTLFVDIDESERERYENLKSRFENLKTTLFQNSDQLLDQAKNRDQISTKKALREAQLNMMFDWEQFGFTEDLFFKMYQCHRNHLNPAQDVQERAKLIGDILEIEANLTLLFKIRQISS